MDFLIDPNVAYVLLILGFLTAVLALLSPGTGLLELIALFALALAGYEIANLNINLWALIVMAVGIVPFLVALRAPREARPMLIAAAALAFVIGSTFLFRGESWLPVVSPVLVILLAPLAIGGTWWMTTKSMEAIAAKPVFDLDRLVGMTGQASSDIRGQGTVYVNGEEWTALSRTFIPAGSPVRVVRRKGLALEVEIVKP